MKRHVVLVGLPGSGKSTVGALVAKTLHVGYYDVDREIEASQGKSVASIFAGMGEAGFRKLESAAVQSLLDRKEPSVIAPGGGWAAQNGNLQAVRGRALCIYLETTPETAVARASQAGERPVLPVGQELSAMQALLRNRKRYYAVAGPSVETDGLTAVEVAGRVAELARTKGAL